MKFSRAILLIVAALGGGVLLGYHSGGRKVSPGMFWLIIGAAIGVGAWNRWRREQNKPGK